MRRAALAALFACAGLTPGAAAAEAAGQPRSAIPWLSQSLRAPPAPAAPLPRPPLVPPGPADATIEVTPLGAIALDAVGLLPPERTGFSRALWGPASALQVRALILAHPDRGVPEARALFRRILLAEADPPTGSGAAAAVLVARIDRLMALGALEEARALIDQAGVDSPDLFRRYFDLGLLLDEAGPACDALRRNPALSPTLPARILCLARDGDWNAAEITLTLGRNVGELTDAEELALARFLDPEPFEDTPDPGPPEPFTPLDFLLREAVGLPRPPGTLPAAFLHHDLADYAPMRARVTAAERLVLTGAVPPAVLFEAYRAGRPAASGGVWDRAAAVQALDAASDSGDAAAIGAALIAADAALRERGLRVALAREYAGALTGLDAASLEPAARTVLIELLLLGDAYRAAATAAGPAPAPDIAVLLTAAGEPTSSFEAAGRSSALARAALEGLTLARPPDERAGRLAALIAEGREGEALLASLELLAEGVTVDPPALRAALFALRRAGQEASARRIALQTLLLDPGEEG